MRKFAAGILSLALALGLCTSALAEENHMSNFARLATYSGQFQDVWSGAWYAGAVKTCYEYGLMNGTYGKFNPQNNLSVAETLAIADRIHETYTTGKSTLQSGSGADWYLPYVDYALENGLVQEGDFTDYTRPATRAEVAYIFADALPPAELHAINSIDHLSDVSQGKYYNSILLLYNAGVLTGTGPNCAFHPNDTITRAEIAAVASRMAVPKERKSFILYDENDLSAVLPGLTVYLPLGSAAQEEDAAHLVSASGLYACEVSVSEGSEFPDKTAGKNALAEALAAQGYTVDIASVRWSAAQFGDTAAHRYQFNATDSDGKSRLCFGYVFLSDGKLCTVSFLTQRDSTEFRTVIDALTLDGAPMTLA